MKKVLLALAIAGLSVTGCQKKAPAPAPAAGSTEIAPPPSSPTPYTPAATMTPAPSPMPVDPPYTAAPSMPAPAAPAPAVVHSAAPKGNYRAGGTYVVVKGDTYYGISKKVYGTTKRAKAIMAANPSIPATKLKVGQKIKLP